MDPLGSAMQQLRQTAGISEKQVVLNKRTAALELASVEGEIEVATARIAVAEAEINKLRIKLAAAQGDQAETDYLDALIAATTTERDTRRSELESLTSYLEIKQELAELQLDVDPNAMNQVVAMMGGMLGDDPDSQ